MLRNDSQPASRHAYDSDMPEPDGLSEAQFAELDAFFGAATYGDGLSCVEYDARARWSEVL